MKEEETEEEKFLIKIPWTEHKRNGTNLKSFHKTIAVRRGFRNGMVLPFPRLASPSSNLASEQKESISNFGEQNGSFVER